MNLIVKTAKLKITSHSKLFLPTLDIYRQALSFYVSAVNEHLKLFAELKSNFIVSVAERLTHATVKNPSPEMPFDNLNSEFYVHWNGKELRARD